MAVYRSVIYSVICLTFSLIALAKMVNQKEFDRLSCSILYCRRLCMYSMYCCTYFSPELSTTNKNSISGSYCIDQEKQLLKAAGKGRVKKVATLLDQGIDVECKDKVINRNIHTYIQGSIKFYVHRVILGN